MKSTEKELSAAVVGLVVGIGLTLIFSATSIHIPDAVWAAVIASALTLSGVFLTNRSYSNRQVNQLNHEKELHKIEREMALRRDVYLKVAEAVSNAQAIFMRMPDVNLSNDLVNSIFMEQKSAIARLQLIASNDTVETVNEYLKSFAKNYLELLLERLKLFDIQTAINIYKNMEDSAITKQNQFLEMMTNYNLQSTRDPQIWDNLLRNHDLQTNQRKEHRTKINELSKQQTILHLDLIENCTNRFNEFSRLIPQALFSIRKELELDIDEEKFIADFERNQKSATDFMKKLIIQIKENANE